MCGIAGAYNFKNSKEISENDIQKMRDTIAHRGPDDAGTYISPDKKIGLGNRRLAILDLSPAGHMPMQKNNVWITYNGEIYNFRELRKELSAKSYKFESSGDTEVILASYLEYGPDFVKHLNGMFAIALWDENKKIFLAARDHVGIKPFYYAVQDGTFYFASEIKAILAHPSFKKELNSENISYFLTFGMMSAPHTLFKDVFKLPAAHRLIIDESGIKEEEYWNPLKPEHKLPKNISEEEIISKTKELIKDSIRMQMVSDVPFGCFLSGGIDSSLNASLMSQALGKPVETFTIGTKDNAEKYNEFEYSRKVAKNLGAKTHEKIVSFEDFTKFLENYGLYADDPNADPTCFLVYYLSQLVHDSGVVVVQTGEGGDELFAGYETYKKALKFKKYWKIFSFLGLGKIAKFFARNDFQKEYALRLSRGEEPFWGHALAFGRVEKKKLLKNNFNLEKDYEPIKKYYSEIETISPNLDFLNQAAFIDLKTRIADFLLMRVDKMAMAHSIEARVPFLDYRIVELALQIPSKIKLKNGELKYVLKKVARGEIPDEIIDRKKQGFGAPVEEWFRDEEKSKVLMDKIYHSNLANLNILNYDYTKKLHTEHVSGKNHTFKLMTLLSLSLWYDKWF